MKVYTYIALILLLQCAVTCSAQNVKDSSIQDSLKYKHILHSKATEVNFEAPISNTQNGLKSNTIQLRPMQTGTLADAMAEKSSIYIKSYGTGLATPSFRGTGANHTKVNWYGLNLNSPMLGVFDLNLMPLFLVDNISIDYGNAAIKTNSGALGGAITLSGKGPANDSGYKIKALIGIGSFAQEKGYISYNIQQKYKSGGSLDANTSIYYQGAKNDYPYINTAKLGDPVETQKNAEMYQLGVMEDVQRRIDSNNVILGTFWYQKTDRKLPGLMTSSGGTESQFDESTRARLCFTHNSLDHLQQYSISANYSGEYLLYKDTLSHVESKSHFNRFQASGYYTWLLGKYWTIDAGTMMLYDRAVASDGYKTLKQQYRMDLPLNVAFNNHKRHRESIIMRPQTIDFNKYVINAVGGYSYDLSKNKDFVFLINAGRNHNFPTLNDLYWNPGGNPLLRPEKAWMTETGLTYAFNKNLANTNLQHFGAGASVNVFSNLIDDYILWQPSSLGYWTAQNLRKVWARGYEATANGCIGISNHQELGTVIGYSYTQSTNEKTANQYDNSVGKQIIYVPENVATGLIYYKIKNLRLNLNYQYTGIRYTPDNYLPAYSLWNVSANYMLVKRAARIDIELKCNNVLNTNYQAIAYRAMPGRWFELNLRFFLK